MNTFSKVRSVFSFVKTFLWNFSQCRDCRTALEKCTLVIFQHELQLNLFNCESTEIWRKSVWIFFGDSTKKLRPDHAISLNQGLISVRGNWFSDAINECVAFLIGTILLLSGRNQAFLGHNTVWPITLSRATVSITPLLSSFQFL